MIENELYFSLPSLTQRLAPPKDPDISFLTVQISETSIKIDKIHLKDIGGTEQTRVNILEVYRQHPDLDLDKFNKCITNQGIPCGKDVYLERQNILESFVKTPDSKTLLALLKKHTEDLNSGRPFGLIDSEYNH